MKNEISIIVKTFKRPEYIERFIDSVRKYYPEINILVADDSDESFVGSPIKLWEPRKNVFYWKMPFNSGLSSGRNFLISKVKTKYVVLCDDDFIFCEDTKLETLYENIKLDTADIIGGLVGGKNAVEYNFTLQKINGKLHYIKKHRYFKNDLYFYDVIPNFFIAKTAVLKKIKWDNSLKLVEHSDFFLRAMYAGTRTAFINKVRVLHDHQNTENYKQYRNDVSKYKEMFMKKHGITELVKNQEDFEKIRERNFTCEVYKNFAWMNIRDLSFIFKRQNKKHWLSNGNLLGICRAGDLIDHDTDTDFMLPIEDLDFELIEEIKAQGFKILRLFGKIETGIEIATVRNGVKADLFFACKIDNKSFYVSCFKDTKQIRYKYSNVKTKWINWKNIKISIPEKPAKHLKESYGNWEKPDSAKKWDWAFSPENIMIEPFKTIEDFKENFNKLEKDPDNEIKSEPEALKYLAEKLGNGRNFDRFINVPEEKREKKKRKKPDLENYEDKLEKHSKSAGIIESYVLNMENCREKFLDFDLEQSKTGLISQVIRPVSTASEKIKSLIRAFNPERPEIKAKELSHQLTFSGILKSAKADKIIIFEDDTIFTDKFDSQLKKILEDLPEDFGVCYLGCYIKRRFKLRKYSENLIEFIEPTHKIWGSHGIIFNKIIYKELSKALADPASLQTDWEIARQMIGKKRCFFAWPMITFQNPDLNSEIGHGLDFRKMERENPVYIEANLNL